MSIVGPSVALVNAVSSIAENTVTATRLKIADIAGIGGVTGPFSVQGADAAFFEVVGTELFLKAGTLLDFESKAGYAVRVAGQSSLTGSTVTSGNHTLAVADTTEGALINGGFETGTLAGWQATGFVAPGNAVTVHPASSGLVREGSYAASLNFAAGPPVTALSQTFGTFAGVQYDFSFWLGSATAINSRAAVIVEVLGVGGATLFTNSLGANVGATAEYRQISHSFVADGSQATIRFADQDPFPLGSGVLLDTVSVTPALAVLSIAATSADKAEGQAGTTPFTFTVTRTGTTTISHNATWTVSGADVTAADFVGGGPPTGTVSFAAGETSKVITVNVAGDGTLEADEAFTVTLSGANASTAFGTATAAGTIRNDDSALSIAATSADKAEGQSLTTPYTFTVTRVGNIAVTHSASWAVSGAAVTGADFASGTLPAGTVTFAAGETSKIITVNVIGDKLVEADEAFTVTVGGATATGVIRNDDATLSIAATSADKAEGQSGSTPYTFTVTRTGSTAITHSAAWTVSGATVTGADFAGNALPGGTVTFAIGETSKVITVDVAGDTAFEADEAFSVTLSASDASIGTATAAGTIRNDDLKPNSAPAFSGLPAANALREETHGVWLAPAIAIADTELAAAGTYAGASLTLSRQGGADATDYFGISTSSPAALPGMFPVAAEGELLRWDGKDIATVTRNSGGVFTLVFNADATQARVNDVLRRIGYIGTSNTPAASVAIDWLFSDGNTGAQGPGGLLTATATTIVETIDRPNTPIFSMGTAASQTIQGLAGEDALDGADGDDLLRGNLASDTLYGGGGNDLIEGGAGDDSLYGEDGNDSLNSGPGADLVDGGLGLDFATYRESSVGVVVNLETGGSGGWAEGDLYESIEGVEGSGAADTIFGTAGLNSFRASWGNDSYDGRGGSDLYATNAAWGVEIRFGADAAGLATLAGITLPSAAHGIAAKTDSIGARRYDLLFDIENFAGGDRNDIIRGNAADNVIFGSLGIDVLSGGGGFDSFVSWFNDVVDLEAGKVTNTSGAAATISSFEAVYGSTTGNETLLGNAAANRLDGRGGNDNLSGRGGNDHVLGGDGTDFVLGDAGNDLLEGGKGGDRLDGGTGVDTATYIGSETGVEVDLLQGRGLGTGSDSAGDRLINIENLIGSREDDVLTGDNAANVMAGDRGADKLSGCDGDDAMYGDALPLATAALPEAGYFAALEALDDVDCGCGSDSSDGSGNPFDLKSSMDLLIGGNGSDSLYGQRGSDLLLGGCDNDFLYGGSEFDILSGDEADDVLDGGASFDFLLGGLGFDIASYAASSEGVTVDLSAPWTATGGDAAGDWVTEILGQITSATDVGATFLSSTFAMLIGNLNTAIEASGGRSLFAVPDFMLSVEGLTGSAFSDVLTGNGGANALAGGTGRDKLSGGGGDDVLSGGGNKDELDGGTGIDVARYDEMTGAVAVTLAGSSVVQVRVDGRAEDTLRNVEGIVGGSAADRLTGDGLDNRLAGGGGNDELKGEAGDDLLAGGAGADVLDGGTGLDDADFGDKTASVVVELLGSAASVAKVGGLAEDSLRNIENVIGGTGADSLTGDTLDNRLAGGAGDDVLKGGDGDDLLFGGDGIDVLDGNKGLDTAAFGEKLLDVSVVLNGGNEALVSVGGVVEDRLRNVENLIGGAGNDSLTGDNFANVLKGGLGLDSLDGGGSFDTADFSDKDQSVEVALNGASAVTVRVGGIAEDTLRNIENLIGGADDDVLSGDTKANLLTGNAGDDRLRGGGGLDVLTGGDGDDIFDFRAALVAGNVATVVDFQAGQDTIWLSAAIFSTAGGLGGLAPNAFHIGAAADDADTRVLYNAATGALSYDADGTGVKAAAQFASLKPGLALSAGDFQIG